MPIERSGGGSGGDVVLLASTTVGLVPAANIDITGISGAFSTLRLTIIGRGTTAAGDVDVGAQLNGDTGANYDTIGLVGIPGGTPQVISFQNVGTTSMNIATVTGSTATASAPGATTIDFIGYSQTTFHKLALVHDGRFDDTAGTIYRIADRTCRWRSTAAITRIKLTPAAGNFDTGTAVALYGYV